MLQSVADTYGRGGVAVVLSGMGRDGAAGCGHLAAQGGTVLAQDQDSSAIWGMPRAVAEAGLASFILPPADIGRRILSRIGDSGWN
jgi:two-component system chemotaxis response regulator CheB